MKFYSYGHLQLYSSLGLYGLSGHPSLALHGTESKLCVWLFKTAQVPKNIILKNENRETL